jgi:hypothetical protein
MATETTSDKAEASVNAVLDGGQSVTQGDMSVSKAALRDAHAILKDEQDRTAQRSGRRPLFRGINLSGVE